MKFSSAPTLTTLALFFSIALVCPAQTAQHSSMLTIAGQPDQATLVRVNGKSYVDIESLARLLHASVRFQGTQTILTLPGAASGPAIATAATKPPQLSTAYLTAQIEALAQIREWRAALVNAVQNNSPITDGAMSPLHRTADSKLQLAIAAASTEPDQQATVLLRNEFTAMQQLSDQYVAAHNAATYIAPDALDSNPQDQKLTACEQALGAMASTKQFQDSGACR